MDVNYKVIHRTYLYHLQECRCCGDGALRLASTCTVNVLVCDLHMYKCVCVMCAFLCLICVYAFIIHALQYVVYFESIYTIPRQFQIYASHKSVLGLLIVAITKHNEHYSEEQPMIF